MHKPGNHFKSQVSQLAVGATCVDASETGALGNLSSDVGPFFASFTGRRCDSPPTGV